ncbi:hypothetical protein [Nostoc sp.]|uniref:hypothetical protein n=1 Tax=Nostoc sp. TaxID=1180 RepID=UPI002FFAAC9B
MSVNRLLPFSLNSVKLYKNNKRYHRVAIMATDENAESSANDENKFESCLRGLGNLWLVAFIALLSFIFFGGFLGLDQILEFYRVFVLNIGQKGLWWREISLSIVFFMPSILLLCLCLFSSQRLLNIPEKPYEANDKLKCVLKYFQVKFFSSVPLLSIAIGFFRSNSGFEDQSVLWLTPQLEVYIFLISWVLWFIFPLAWIKWIEDNWIKLIQNIPFIYNKKHKKGEKFTKLVRVIPITIGIIIILLFSNFRGGTQIFDTLSYYFFLLICFIYLTLSVYFFDSIFNNKRQIQTDCENLQNELRDEIKLRNTLPFLVLSFLGFVIIVLIHGTSSPYIFQSVCQTFGSITLIALFLVTLLALVYPLYYFGFHKNIQITAFAAIIVPVILAFGFSGFDWNDNHQIRLITPSKEKVEQQASKPLETLDSKFKKWLNAREKEIKEPAQKIPYPIYIISAQGGGIFAAYHAASTLSRLQDLCPAFAHHVFAISGVSGGSLGAAAFSSLVKTAPKPSLKAQDCSLEYKESLKEADSGRGLLEKKAHELLDKDLLSPLLGAGLFSDFVQRFIPIPIESLDRARGLEYAFEGGWKSKWGNNPLADSYYKHWNPDKDDAPALILNTTVVGTGERLLLSPFKFNSPDSKFPPLNDIDTVACSVNGANIDFPLSTAAVLSARFPLVTPVGWFKKCNDANGERLTYKNGLKTRLADGGYFENSGFTTARDIGQRLEKILEDRKKKFKVVYLAITDNSFLEPSKVQGLNELLSPIIALLNSREARGRSVIKQGEYELDGKIDKTSNLKEHRFRQFYLTHVDGETLVKNNKEKKNNGKTLGKALELPLAPKLPLGWYLSGVSQNAIRDRVGYPSKCSSEKNDNNNCVMKSIIEEIMSSQ